MPTCPETTQLPKASALQRNEQDVRRLALACGDRDCSSPDLSVVPVHYRRDAVLAHTSYGHPDPAPNPAKRLLEVVQ